ncbi:MAG: phosphoadenosine phosphosulfate reductase family protein [Bacteroidetes bacterium]|jgi:3'-phosphoadenosine 5'-phosphosulfate sulfotransferase (PAPS reductase)/FAD synthetase|nr:phosphoadenosine phosphosulfate reductase family protein [Bacteroidota bacterium]
MKKIRHVLGISGGKDSAALAIYMKDKYPHLDIEYYTCDTGKELEETYQLIKNLEIYLGKKITLLKAAEGSDEDPFDHYLKMYGGFLPSSNSRWCTKKLKLEPFEKFVGNDPVISYVGIRGDEEREGYISRKPNIQSIFPFRKNIWSEDVILKVLSNNNSKEILNLFSKIEVRKNSDRIEEVLRQPISLNFSIPQKLSLLLDLGIKEFNELVFAFLKTTNYPLANELNFELTDNEDVLVRDDIFRILKESGVGIPAYYNKVDFKTDGKAGQYARSRSGCYFCFFQQKIEWVWLYEQHPDRFAKAMEYEKDGYTWCQDETLSDIIKPERIKRIKEEFLMRQAKAGVTQKDWKDIVLEEAESEGCAACFI